MVVENAPVTELVIFSVGLVIGMLVPTYYGMERLRGFGRAIAQKLPYEPPPGVDREEAMQDAVDEKNQ